MVVETTGTEGVSRYLVVFPGLGSDEIANAIAQEVVVLLKFNLDGSPMASRDMDAEGVNGLLPTDGSLLHQVTSFLFDGFNSISGGCCESHNISL